MKTNILFWTLLVILSAVVIVITGHIYLIYIIFSLFIIMFVVDHYDSHKRKEITSLEPQLATSILNKKLPTSVSIIAKTTVTIIFIVVISFVVLVSFLVLQMAG